jgi:hypothetical protein
MNLIPRAAAAAPLSLALVLAAATATSAQVASLVSPDETAAPEEATTVIEFADREEALLAYAQCMRDHGVEMDDPTPDQGGARRFFGGGPGGPDRFDEEFQVANQSCGVILEAARPEIDLAAQQERLENELQMAQCFRDNGYPEYPDPSVDADGRLQRGGGAFTELGIDRRSEAFLETRLACGEQLGIEDLRGPGSGRGGDG